MTAAAAVSLGSSALGRLTGSGWLGSDSIDLPGGGLWEVEVPSALPRKVYRTAALGISRETHDAHLGLWQGYAKKTNEIRRLLMEPAALEAPNQIYSQMRALKTDYAFALGGYVNHAVYFDNLGSFDGSPFGTAEVFMNYHHGGFERWKEEMIAVGMASRGWVYWAYDTKEVQTTVFAGDSQSTFPMWNQVLMVAVDVYEHAYFLDFGADRRSYLEANLRALDWSAIDRRIPAVG